MHDSCGNSYGRSNHAHEPPNARMLRHATILFLFNGNALMDFSLDRSGSLHRDALVKRTNAVGAQRSDFGEVDGIDSRGR